MEKINISQITAILTPLILFLGFCKEYLYYSNFGIDRVDYLTNNTQIIYSLLASLSYFVTIMTFLYLLIILPSAAYIMFSSWGMSIKKTMIISTGLSSIFILPIFFISDKLPPFNGLLDTILLVFLVLFPLFLNYSYSKYWKEKLTPFPEVIKTIDRVKDKYRSKKMIYRLIYCYFVLLFVTILSVNNKTSNLKQGKDLIKHVTFTHKGQETKTDSMLVFVEKSEKFIFLYDRKECEIIYCHLKDVENYKAKTIK